MISYILLHLGTLIYRILSYACWITSALEIAVETWKTLKIHGNFLVSMSRK